MTAVVIPQTIEEAKEACARGDARAVHAGLQEHPEWTTEVVYGWTLLMWTVWRGDYVEVAGAVGCGCGGGLVGRGRLNFADGDVPAGS